MFNEPCKKKEKLIICKYLCVNIGYGIVDSLLVTL